MPITSLFHIKVETCNTSWDMKVKVSLVSDISGLSISKYFYLSGSQNLTFFKTDYIEFRRKLCLKSTWPIDSSLALSCWAVVYVEHDTSSTGSKWQRGKMLLQNHSDLIPCLGISKLSVHLNHRDIGCCISCTVGMTCMFLKIWHYFCHWQPDAMRMVMSQWPEIWCKAAASTTIQICNDWR